MDTLILQIDRKRFLDIMNGNQKIESRYIYPNNASKYVIDEDDMDENGEPCQVVTPIHYDTLTFINGRRKDSPRMVVNVESEEFAVITDAYGNDIKYDQNGKTYYACQVSYKLGSIVSIANAESIIDVEPK